MFVGINLFLGSVLVYRLNPHPKNKMEKFQQKSSFKSLKIIINTTESVFQFSLIQTLTWIPP